MFNLDGLDKLFYLTLAVSAVLGWAVIEGAIWLVRNISIAIG